ncbi:MAG: hypothetical protein H2069_07850 [Legionella sp.]|nr:hypothetical protein [Legionella sp.]
MTLFKFFLAVFFPLSVSASWALPAPKYLSVPHWKDCVQTRSQGSANFVCLPSKQPSQCPSSTWKKLSEEHLLPNCSSNS